MFNFDPVKTPRGGGLVGSSRGSRNWPKATSLRRVSGSSAERQKNGGASQRNDVETRLRAMYAITSARLIMRRLNRGGSRSGHDRSK
jgi:hypothetical protein